MDLGQQDRSGAAKRAAVELIDSSPFWNPDIGDHKRLRSRSTSSAVKRSPFHGSPDSPFPILHEANELQQPRAVDQIERLTVREGLRIRRGSSKAHTRIWFRNSRTFCPVGDQTRPSAAHTRAARRPSVLARDRGPVTSSSRASARSSGGTAFVEMTCQAHASV
jgi:hypothetical protein